MNPGEYCSSQESHVCILKNQNRNLRRDVHICNRGPVPNHSLVVHFSFWAANGCSHAPSVMYTLKSCMETDLEEMSYPKPKRKKENDEITLTLVSVHHSHHWGMCWKPCVAPPWGCVLVMLTVLKCPEVQSSVWVCLCTCCTVLDTPPILGEFPPHTSVFLEQASGSPVSVMMIRHECMNDCCMHTAVLTMVEVIVWICHCD